MVPESPKLFASAASGQGLGQWATAHAGSESEIPLHGMGGTGHYGQPAVEPWSRV